MAIHSSTSTRTSSHTAGFHSLPVFWPAGEAATILWLFSDYATILVSSSKWRDQVLSRYLADWEVVCGLESWSLSKRTQVHFPTSMWSVTPAAGALTPPPLLAYKGMWHIYIPVAKTFMFIKQKLLIENLEDIYINEWWRPLYFQLLTLEALSFSYLL